MIVKSVSVGLILCALLSVAPPPAASQTAPPPSTSSGVPAAAPLSGESAVLWLNVVKDGRAEMQALRQADLAKTSPINVDGYVNGIVLLSTVPLRMAIDGKPVHPIRRSADGFYKVKYFGYLNRTEFWSTFHSDAFDQAAMDTIRSSYSSFPKIPGDALSEAAELHVTLTQKDTEKHLTLRQVPARKLDVCPEDGDRATLQDVYYLGNDDSQFANDPEAFRARVQAVLEGVQAVERFNGNRIVDRINLVDFEGQHNAYTCSGESDIWIYRRLFWREPIEELRTIAAHETMHILSDRLGLPSNSHIRNLYADLMGFGVLSRERFAVMTSGRPPAYRGTVRPDASRVFDFINESNFIRGMKGGHAQDDLDEFCASFLHTLMFIDRLEAMVAEPIKHKDGSFTTLTAGERQRLLEDYHTILAAVAEEIPRRRFKPLEAAIRAGLAAAVTIDARLEARR